MFCDPLPHAGAKRAALATLGQLLFLRSLRAMGPRKTSECLSLHCIAILFNKIVNLTSFIDLILICEMFIGTYERYFVSF